MALEKIAGGNEFSEFSALPNIVAYALEWPLYDESAMPVVSLFKGRLPVARTDGPAAALTGRQRAVAIKRKNANFS
jgi:hypothetical protein